MKKLIEKKENEIEEIKIRITKEEHRLDEIREAQQPKVWVNLIRAERDLGFGGWLAEVEAEGRRVWMMIQRSSIRGGKRFEGEVDTNTLTILKQPSHTGGRVRVNESALKAALDYQKEKTK